MGRQALCWLCLICVAISLSSASPARAKRDLQTIRTIKDIIFDKVFGPPASGGVVVAAEEPEVKLFKIPGHNHILVKAVPVVAPEPVLEVIPPSAPIQPTVALIQSYLGTTTLNETLKALDGVQLLLKSGVLSRTALDKLFVSHPPLSAVKVSDEVYSSDLHLPVPYPAAQPFTVVEKTFSQVPHSSYGVPIGGPVVFDKPVEIKEVPRPVISVPSYGVPLPEQVVISERKPVAVDVFPGPAVYQSFQSALPGFGAVPVQQLRPLPIQEIRPFPALNLVQDVRFLPGPVQVQDVRLLPGSQLAPLPVPDFRPVQEIRTIAGHDISVLPGPQFRPLPVPFIPVPVKELKPLPGPELRPLPVPEFRPLPVPQFSPLPVPNFRPLPVLEANVRPVQVQEIVSNPFQSIYSYNQDGVVFASNSGELRKVPFHPITAIRPIIVERIKQISEKMAKLPKPVKVEIEPPVVPVPLDYLQVPKIVSGPFRVVEPVNKESASFLYQQVSKDGTIVSFPEIPDMGPLVVSRIQGIADQMANTRISTLVHPFLSRLIKKSDSNGGYYYERINDDGSVTKLSAEEVENALPLSDTNTVITGGSPVVIIPEQLPFLSRLVKKSDDNGGYYYERINKDGSVTKYSAEEVGKLFLSRLVRKTDSLGEYYYQLTNDDGTVSIFYREDIESVGQDTTVSSVNSRVKPPSESNGNTPEKAFRGPRKYLYRQENADGTVTIYTGFQKGVDVKMPQQAEIDFTLPSKFGDASVNVQSPVVAGQDQVIDVSKGPVHVHPIIQNPSSGFSFQQVNIDGSVTTFPGKPSIVTKLPATGTGFVPPRLPNAEPVFVHPALPINPAIGSLPVSSVVLPVPAPELGPVHVHGIPSVDTGSAAPAPIAVLKPVVSDLSPAVIEVQKAPHFGPVHVHEIQKFPPVNPIPVVAAPPTIYGVPLTGPIKESNPFVSALPRISVPSFRPGPVVKPEPTLSPDYVFVPPGTDLNSIVASYVYKQIVNGNPNAAVTHVNINAQPLRPTDSTDPVQEKGGKAGGGLKESVAASGGFKYTQIISNPSSSTESSPTTECATFSEEGSLSQNPIVVVSEDKGQYSYTQTNSDGSSLKVLGNGQNQVTVDLDSDKDKEESHRGDVP